MKNITTVYIFVDENNIPISYSTSIGEGMDYSSLNLYSRLMGKDLMLYDFEDSSKCHIQRIFDFNDDWTISSNKFKFSLSKKDVLSLRFVSTMELYSVRLVYALYDFSRTSIIGYLQDYNRVENYRLRLQEKGIICDIRYIILKNKDIKIYYSATWDTYSPEKNKNNKLCQELTDDLVAKYVLLR